MQRPGSIDSTVRAPFRVLGALLLSFGALLFAKSAIDQFGQSSPVTASCEQGKGRLLCEVGRAIVKALPQHLQHTFLGVGAALFALAMAAVAVALLYPLIPKEEDDVDGAGNQQGK
jgi:hypothetical protein